MDNDPVIEHVIDWANADPRVRAVIWTSSRAKPGATVDALSDYDIVLVVDDIGPFASSRSWLHDFGPLLVLFSDGVEYENGYPSFTNVTQYEDGLKIDFHVMGIAQLRIWAAAPALTDELDVGYLVLLDKDALAATLPPPTYLAHIPQPPDEATYLALIEEFFHEGTYVVKNLWRDELMPAKYSFDHVMKTKLLRVLLEWRIELDHDWSVRPGVLGKGLKKWLPADLWAALERTYVGADIAENWIAFFATLDLFREVAVEVGERLGYAYPHELDRRATAYFRDVQALDRRAPAFQRILEEGAHET